MSIECPLVSIESGKIKGSSSRATDPDSKWVFHFFGIPYGNPATGELRFANPQKCDPWNGVLDATKLCADPPQDATLAAMYGQYYPFINSLQHDHFYQSEDCLRMNVFTPSCNNTEKKAVMLYIIGGGFIRCNAMRYDGTALAGMNDVVIVCPNYRPNALGFLSLGQDSKCPGNMSIQDILLALRWVQDNISSFGGDPNNVTIFGESAGAVMSHILMLSRKSEGLFHKAIVMSCTANFPAMFSEDGRPATNDFLKKMNINHDESADNILNKLRELHIDEIIQAESGHSTNENLGTFKPCVDGDILSDTPSNILKQANFKGIPMLAGVAANEMGGIMSLRNPPKFQEGLSKEELSQFLLKVIVSFTHTSEEKVYYVVELLMNSYGKKLPEEDEYKYSKMYSDIATDLALNVPLLNAVLANSMTSSPTFLYVMDHPLEFNHSEVNGPGIKNKLDFVTTDHGDICHFVFGQPFIHGKLNGGAWFTDEDRLISRHTMTYFTNFAKTSDPNKGNQVPCNWPAYLMQSKQHIVLKAHPDVDNNFRSEQTAMFNQMFAGL